MAVERKSANSKSSILQKVKNSNTKNNEKTTSKPVKKTTRANVRKKLTDEEIKESEKAKKALNVDPNSPLFKEEIKPIEENIDTAFTQTEDGEDLKSINIGRKRKPKKKAEEEIAEIEKDNSAELEAIKRKEEQELEDKEILEAAKREFEKSQEESTNTEEIAKEEIKAKKVKDKKPIAWNVTIKPATLLFTGFIAFIGLGVFFTFGLIVGQDLTPVSEAIPLETISSNTRNNTISSNTETLKAEELHYAGELKVAPALPEEESEETELIQAIIDPATGQLVPYNPNTGEEILAVEPVEVVEAPQEPIMYDFSLRAVSYTDEAQADALRQRLEGDGMRTQLITEKKNNKTWYYVHINFRGTEENFNTMRNNLSKYRISGTVVTSKKEV